MPFLWHNEVFVWQITILVAAEGVHELPTINGSGDLKETLQKLGSIPSSKILVRMRTITFILFFLRLISLLFSCRQLRYCGPLRMKMALCQSGNFSKIIHFWGLCNSIVTDYLFPCSRRYELNCRLDLKWHLRMKKLSIVHRNDVFLIFDKIVSWCAGFVSF